MTTPLNTSPPSIPLLETQSTERLWQKSITFDVKGESMVGNAYWEVLNILIENIPIIDKDYELRSAIRDKLYDLDLSNYYTGVDRRGPKFTKVVKKVLKESIADKALYEPFFPTVARKISELYLPQTTLTAFWGLKELIGEGKWESSSTCFSTTGCNSVSKKFVKRFRRTQVLVLASEGVRKRAEVIGYKESPCPCGAEGCTRINKDPIFKEVETPATNYSRCLVHFLGGRRIQLLNFYYNGLPQNYRIHVEALRRLLGVSVVTFKRVDSNLPIYTNGDCVEVDLGRSKAYDGEHLYPCPHCSRKVKASRFHHDYNDNTYYIGCSEECAGHPQHTCCNCSSSVDEDDLMTNENGDEYCSSCYHDIYTYCEHCNSEVSRKSYDFNSSICHNCGVRCVECRDYFDSDDIREANDRSYCQSCFDKQYTYCSECDEVIMISKDDLCTECREKADKEEKKEKEEGVNI